MTEILGPQNSGFVIKGVYAPDLLLVASSILNLNRSTVVCESWCRKIGIRSSFVVSADVSDAMIGSETGIGGRIDSCELFDVM